MIKQNLIIAKTMSRYSRIDPEQPTELPITAPPVATAVAMTYFVVAWGGPTVREKFSHR